MFLDMLATIHLLIPLEGGANLPIINGLIDVETGAILDKNVQAVLEKLNIV